MRYYLCIVVSIAFLAYVHSDSCVQCDSSTDPKCATTPDVFFAKNCSNETSKCYSRVTAAGYTIRGCAVDLDNSTSASCNNEQECLECTYMEGCNRQIFPSHRLRCIECEGNSTSHECAVNKFASVSVCPLYKLGDRCYIRNTGVNGTASFQRGCLSSAHAKKLCMDSQNCYICDGMGCNNLPFDSDQIPLARDSAQNFGISMILVAATFVVARLL